MLARLRRASARRGRAAASASVSALFAAPAAFEPTDSSPSGLTNGTLVPYSLIWNQNSGSDCRTRSNRREALARRPARKPWSSAPKEPEQDRSTPFGCRRQTPETGEDHDHHPRPP